MKRIVARQKEDGGWAQTKDAESDAYATGQALYALAEQERNRRTQRSSERAGVSGQGPVPRRVLDDGVPREPARQQESQEPRSNLPCRNCVGGHGIRTTASRQCSNRGAGRNENARRLRRRGEIRERSSFGRNYDPATSGKSSTCTGPATPESGASIPPLKRMWRGRCPSLCAPHTTDRGSGSPNGTDASSGSSRLWPRHRKRRAWPGSWSSRTGRTGDDCCRRPSRFPGRVAIRRSFWTESGLTAAARLYLELGFQKTEGENRSDVGSGSRRREGVDSSCEAVRCPGTRSVAQDRGWRALRAASGSSRREPLPFTSETRRLSCQKR